MTGSSSKRATMRGCALLVIVIAPLVSRPAASQDQFLDYLRSQGSPPADYVLSKLRTHRVVLLGEHHWIRHDVELVLSLIPRLRDAGVQTLAFEILDAEYQDDVDRLVESDKWMPALAMRLQRAQAWPYREYFEILRAVWESNRSRAEGETTLRLLALGPGSDWRERLLPVGETYDSFMAARILDRARDGGRVLVYAGLNHVFTRFYQPERPRADRVEAFMDRMGNMLRRKLGEETFTIALHRPMPCKRQESWTQCLPASGVIDCAASTLGSPVGFDIVGSPFAGLPLGPEVLYSLGYPSLRLVDFTDGYIWFKEIDEYESASIIPLNEYAPDSTSLEEVAHRNPFSNDEIDSREQFESLWAREIESRKSFSRRFRWDAIAGWRDLCEQP